MCYWRPAQPTFVLTAAEARRLAAALRNAVDSLDVPLR